MRHLLLFPLAFLLACGAGDVEPSDLDLAMQDAADDFGVPYPILAATSWELSRYDARDGAENTEHGVGLMNLRTDGTYPSLADAAHLIGADPDDVAADPALNIQASAALMAAQARARQAQTGEAIDTLQEWYPLVAAWSGAPDPYVADNFAKRVYDLMQWGFAGTAPSGESVIITPVAMEWRRGATLSGSSLVAAWVPASSANYTDDSRGSGDIDMVVIHTTEGSYSGSISWFQNSSASVSAHYVIRSSDGQITQSVDEADIAWHAGHWDTNARSIGIEHEGYVADPGTWYTDSMYRQSAALVADICDRYGIPKDRSHIIGHYEVPGCSGTGGGSGCHTDPGSGWDWDYYISLVTGSSGGGSTSSGGATTKTGTFQASVVALSYGESDTCSGTLSGSINGSAVYLTSTCRLDKHPDKSGDLAVTWSGSVVGTTVSGNLLVDGHSAPWNGTINSDGSINILQVGQEDLGGDVGVISYSVQVNVDP